MKFEWDPDKNEANILKHGVSFEEAETVFDDRRAVTLFDKENSTEEDRFIIIGQNKKFRELTVCHCYRGSEEDDIRIISARKATKQEINLYRR